MTYLLIFLSVLLSNNSNDKKISKNGMTVEWTFLNENSIKFKVTSPEKGWLAIGLNPDSDLVGSNLIMASVSGRKQVISDRFIVGMGDHRSVESLGAESQVHLLSAKEMENGTVVEFLLNTSATDQYHFDIERNKQFYLMMAYSREDDFSHHSAMRTSVKIIF